MKRVILWMMVLFGAPYAAEATPHPYNRNKTIESVDGRPFVLHFPPDSAANPALRPLIILLPGYRTSATMQEVYLQLRVKTDPARIIFAALEGSHDQLNGQFWNGGACCQIFASSADWWVDDVGYVDRVITAIIAEVANTRSISGLSYSIDPDRIFIIGHSSGSFLAQRYACSSTGGPGGASRVAAVVGLSGSLNLFSPESGSTPALTGLCSPVDASGIIPVNRHVSVLQIHATNDHLIPYGGSFMYNGAETSINLWEARNGCTQTVWSPTKELPNGPIPVMTDRFDFLMDNLWGGGTTYRYPTPGSDEIGSNETWIFRSSCQSSTGIAVELWRIIGPGLATGDLSGHIPTFQLTGPNTFAERTVNWLMAHPKVIH